MDKGKDSGLVIPSSALRGGKTDTGYCTREEIEELRRVERGTTRHTLIGTRDSSRTATHTLMHRVQSRAVLCSAVEHILVAWVIAVY